MLGIDNWVCLELWVMSLSSWLVWRLVSFKETVSLVPRRSPPAHSTRLSTKYRWRHEISRQVVWARRERLGTRLKNCAFERDRFVFAHEVSSQAISCFLSIVLSGLLSLWTVCYCVYDSKFTSVFSFSERPVQLYTVKICEKSRIISQFLRVSIAPKFSCINFKHNVIHRWNWSGDWHLPYEPLAADTFWFLT